MRVCYGHHMHMRGARSYLSIYTHVHVFRYVGDTATKVCLHGALALGPLSLTLSGKGRVRTHRWA